MLKSKSLTSLGGQTGRQVLGFMLGVTFSITVGIASVLMLLSVPTAHAQQMLLAQGDRPGQSGNQVPDPSATQPTRISQRQALDLVRARFAGNVISINEVQQREGLFYRVRMDNEGNIFTLYVDAVSGAITREQ